MSAPLPTTRIQDGHGGFIVINESDFDPKEHSRFVESALAPDAPQSEADAAVVATKPAGKASKK